MITEDRLHHIIGVARKAYKIAINMGYDETFAKKCFMLGWNHDIGYEFASSENHATESAKMILLLEDTINPSDLDKKSYLAIKYHSNYPNDITDEYKILTMADMQVDSKGNECDVIDRLNDIKNRYGSTSNEYIISCDICFRLGLTNYNISNIQ